MPENSDTRDGPHTIPVVEPPSYEDSMSDESPPGYDGTVLPAYAETMIEGQIPAAATTASRWSFLVELLRAGAEYVEHDTQLLSQRIQGFQASMSDRSRRSRQYGRLTDLRVELRAFADLAERRAVQGRQHAARVQVMQQALNRNASENFRAHSRFLQRQIANEMTQLIQLVESTSYEQDAALINSYRDLLQSIIDEMIP